jgi:hypothetical protein
MYVGTAAAAAAVGTAAAAACGLTSSTGCLFGGECMQSYCVSTLRHDHSTWWVLFLDRVAEHICYVVLKFSVLSLLFAQKWPQLAPCPI